jgi:hypothetical protein
MHLKRQFQNQNTVINLDTDFLCNLVLIKQHRGRIKGEIFSPFIMFLLFFSFLLKKYEPLKVCKLIKLILGMYVILQFALMYVLLIQGELVQTEKM